MLPLTDLGLAGAAALLDDRLVGRCRCSNWRSCGDGRRMFDGCILCVRRHRYGHHRRGAAYAGQNAVSHLCVTQVLRLGGDAAMHIRHPPNARWVAAWRGAAPHSEAGSGSTAPRHVRN
jgi:hypothetical protein